MLLRPLLPALILSSVSPLPLQQIGASRTALVSVVTDDGRPAVDFDLDDFSIEEGGQSREVLSVRGGDYPIAIVIDTSRSARRDFEPMRRAIVAFVSRLGPRPVAVAASDPPRLLATFDDDRAKVIDRVEHVSQGGKSEGLFRAMAETARAIAETGSRLSAIVVVASGPAAGPRPPVPDAVLESGAQVHVIVRQPTGGRKAGTADGMLESLIALTREARGEFTTIFGADAYALALGSLARQLASELMIEYLVPVGSPKETRVEVGVKTAGVRVKGLGVFPR